MRMEFASPDLGRAVADVTGVAVARIESIRGGGYSPAKRLVATLDDGASVFVKWATEPLTAGWIVKEQQIYRNLGAVPFAPRYFGGGTAPDSSGDPQPFLVLEDLSGCYWPPPWSPGQAEAVRAALDQVHATRGAWMSEVPSATELAGERGWRKIADNPAPFLSLGLCSQQWLDAHLPRLIEAADAAPFAGDDLLHLDTRSDNLCFRRDGRACIVDWNWAARGNGIVDIAGWLPSLSAEAGIMPEDILPHSPEFAAWFAGFFGGQAGLPPPPLAPRVRTVQKQALEAALPWAVRALNLPPLE